MVAVFPYLLGHLGRIEVGKVEVRSSGGRVAYPLRRWVGREEDLLVAGMGLVVSFGPLVARLMELTLTVLHLCMQYKCDFTEEW